MKRHFYSSVENAILESVGYPLTSEAKDCLREWSKEARYLQDALEIFAKAYDFDWKTNAGMIYAKEIFRFYRSLNDERGK